MQISSRADLDALRGTPEFEAALRLIRGATISWTNAGTVEAPDWEMAEDSSVLARFDFSPEDFAAEIVGMEFVDEAPAPVAASPAPIAVPVLYALANLVVADGEVTGLETATNLTMAFMLDVDTCWVFFAESQPDTNYIVMPPTGVTRYADYIEIVAPGATEIPLIVFRVQ